MKKSNFKVFLLLCAVLLALIACSNANSTPTNEQEVNAKENKAGGTVRIAMSTEVDHLDPYQSAATDTMSMMDNVYDGLLDTDESGELVPAIAESYDISENGRVYTFKLKENVMFHDGSELTAEDVKYSYEKLAGLSGDEPISSQFEVIEKVETPSDFEVVITLKETNSAFLAANIRPILPADYDNHSEKPIGAGPFKFAEYKVGQELRLVKYEDYYDEEKVPKLDEVQFKIMPDPESAILAMRSGEIDVIPGISAQGKEQLGDTIETIAAPQNMVQLMALNNQVEPLNDLRVRKAINLVIDKDMIIDMVAEGDGVKLGSNFSPSMELYYQEGLEDTYQPHLNEAKKLLKEAGYKDGFNLELTVPSDYQFHVDTAQVITEQLGQVGIQVDIKRIEFSTWLEKVYNQAQYESTIIGFTGKLDPYEILRRYVSDYNNNFVQFENKEYDALIKEALAATDEKALANIYKQAQTLLTEKAASVFIMDPYRTVAMKKGLQGWKMYPIQKFNLEDLYYTE
ncbi:ABC transporter substrate-binding protein [Virgibacillus sp.]|uniref:ABC transporter substrate-binding protein n=1 Tax=Virgibacillus sp. TaxID=1872700 RepID=UPI0017CFBFF1|nr:ABC transporter substrate-binding protein [Virgibacillus sp.]NWO12224.1 ABC transporter substrate-binding protein [Virgibacillus sp.]